MPSPIHHFPAEIEALPNFDGPFDAHRLQAVGCEVLFATYPAGTTTNNLGVITKGQLILTVEDQITMYGAGDWYHVPAGIEHAARFDTDSAEIEFWFTQRDGATSSGSQTVGA